MKNTTLHIRVRGKFPWNVEDSEVSLQEVLHKICSKALELADSPETRRNVPSVIEQLIRISNWLYQGHDLYMEQVAAEPDVPREWASAIFSLIRRMKEAFNLYNSQLLYSNLDQVDELKRKIRSIATETGCPLDS